MAAVDWIQERVPAWLLILLAGIGTPASIGNVIWNQNNEARMALMEREIADQLQDIANLKIDLASRVRTTERLEMLAELNRRLDQLDRHAQANDDRIERLQDRAFGAPPYPPAR